MTVLKKYNLEGKQIGELSLPDNLVQTVANTQMIKDYIVALRTNQRQWSASTKSKPEVSHSGQKPHPQKGTGRARQGSLAAPQYKGGGRVHAPKPKFDQHVRINKKEKRLAIRHLLSERIKGDCIRILQWEDFVQPKTKKIATFLRALDLVGKRVVFLGERQEKGKYENFIRSLNNLPKVEFVNLSNINGYDLVITQNLIVLDSAVDQLKALLGEQVA